VTRPGPHQKTPLELIDRESPIYKHAAWFLQSLRASRRAFGTIAVYVGTVHEYDKFAKSNGLPRALHEIEREHVEQFLLDQLTRLRPASAASRFAGLRAFFRWALDQGQIDSNPLEKMRPPTVPEVPVPVLTMDQVRALIRACEGKAFKQRRDMALLRLMLNTGIRRSEAAAIRLQDLDLQAGTVVIVNGKGSRSREVSFDAKTASAIYAYQIERDKQPHASAPFLFIGQQGGLSGDAVGAIVQRRARIGGVFNLGDDGVQRPIHAHQTRHTFADRFLAAGGSEGDLQHIGGWRSMEILRRYGQSRASVRAIEASKRLAIGDAY